MEVTELLRAMVAKNASDLYLSVGFPPAVKVEGRLVPLTEEKLSPQETEKFAQALMTPLQQEQFARQLEMDLAYGIPGVGRFRVNVFRQRGTVSLVLRLVKAVVPPFESLGLPEILKKLILEPRGLILVTGATGSGKSTTLAALIDYRKQEMEGHIITIEDPVEFLHPHARSIVNQRDVGVDTISYSHALKSVLREAPDVILIGEIRDQETANAALDFAETGHLVLGTLHSANAPQTIERLVNIFPAAEQEQYLYQLSLNLRAIISQRLMPRAEGSGRVVVVEIMIATARIKELIRKNEVGIVREAIEAGTAEGMQTFDQELLRLYREGVIAEEAALRYADHPGDLKLKIKLAATGKPGEMGIRLKEQV